MASAIDATKPVTGAATTSAVRANFAAAEAEIDELHRATEDSVTAAGTVDALTANFTKDVVLAEGVTIVVKAAGANTSTTPTLNVDSTGVRTIVKDAGVALAVGDISGARHFCIFRYDLANTVWVLMNPSVSGSVSAPLALKADLASPALTGTPTAPTQTAGNSTTRLATTAFVTTADNLKADLASPALTGNPTAPTQAATDSSTRLATTAFVNDATSACKAWIYYNGEGTPSIKADYNVSSITDNAVSDHWVNFSVAMPSANYAVSTSGGDVTYANGYMVNIRTTEASRVRLHTRQVGGNTDISIIMLSVFSL